MSIIDNTIESRRRQQKNSFSPISFVSRSCSSAKIFCRKFYYFSSLLVCYVVKSQCSVSLVNGVFFSYATNFSSKLTKQTVYKIKINYLPHTFHVLIDSPSITVQHCTDLSTKSYKYVYIPKIS